MHRRRINLSKIRGFYQKIPKNSRSYFCHTTRAKVVRRRTASRAALHVTSAPVAVQFVGMTMASKLPEAPSSVVNFPTTALSRGRASGKQLRAGDVTLAQGNFGPTEGMYVGSSEVTVAISEGTPFQIDWRGPDSDRLRSTVIAAGQAHLGHGHRALWIRCMAPAAFFSFGMDQAFIRRIWQSAFDGAGDCSLKLSIGLEDPVIRHFGLLGRRELEHGSAGGRLYAEGLATAFAIHLLRNYSLSLRPLSPYKGGLAPAQLRRVIEYVRAHIGDELSLVELAEVAGLSPHHFAQAFKTSTGLSPHRYVIEKRVEHARELLRDRSRSIAEIAQAVGFSNQSHLTLNFRRLTGSTPGQFRRLHL